jgi:hypothetical protein
MLHADLKPGVVIRWACSCYVSPLFTSCVLMHARQPGLTWVTGPKVCQSITAHLRPDGYWIMKVFAATLHN